MIIRLRESQLFTTDPAKRFADRYDVPESVWKEMWGRHVLLGYTTAEMAGLYQVLTGKKINKRAVKRWLTRTHIYTLTIPVLKQGTEAVTLEFFGKYQRDVLNEVIKFSGMTKNKKLV